MRDYIIFEYHSYTLLLFLNIILMVLFHVPDLVTCPRYKTLALMLEKTKYVQENKSDPLHILSHSSRFKFMTCNILQQRCNV